VTIYADTSALVAFVFDEPHSNRVREWFRRTTQRIIVSDLARLEFPAVVTRSARTRRLNPSEASAALASFDLLAARSRPLRHDRADFTAAEMLVRDFATKLTAPDALHLASAKNAGATLATLDARLAEAARAQGLALAELG
jgi:predicted nucleic acid-binding protein